MTSKGIAPSPLFFLDNDEEYTNIADFAKSKGILPATFRLWVNKSGIKPKFRISKKQIYLTKELLLVYDSNIDKKFLSRANKSNSTKRIISKEHLANKEHIKSLKLLASIFDAKNLEIEKTIYVLAEKIYESASENSPALKNELQEWGDKLGAIENKYDALKNLDLSGIDDPLAVVYTTLIRENYRSENGIYLTPTTSMDKSMLSFNRNDRVLDPCCGSGNLLLFCLDNGCLPENIIGIEKDFILFKICRIRFFEKFPDYHEVKIYNHDFLLLGKNDFIKLNIFENCSFVIMNPPWGGRIDIDSMDSEIYNLPLYIKDSFSAFIFSLKNIISNEGICLCILPESVIHNKTHEGIRNHIENYYSIISLSKFNDSFNSVQSRPILLEFRKTDENRVKFEEIKYSTLEKEILDMIFSIPHFTLKNKANFILGIVTGNNKGYLTESNKDFPCEEVIIGSDIEKFNIHTKKYIRIDLKFQQAAPIEKYREVPKIVYRFIGYKLRFAIDYQGRLTLNSCNIIIPDTIYAPEVICSIFNSNLINYLFLKKYQSNKLLRSHIESFPIPKHISTDNLILLKDFAIKEFSDVDKLNETIYDIYNIPNRLREEIDSYIRGI